jgi:hypothetical protein
MAGGVAVVESSGASEPPSSSLTTLRKVCKNAQMRTHKEDRVSVYHHLQGFLRDIFSFAIVCSTTKRDLYLGNFHVISLSRSDVAYLPWCIQSCHFGPPCGDSGRCNDLVDSSEISCIIQPLHQILQTRCKEDQECQHGLRERSADIHVMCIN